MAPAAFRVQAALHALVALSSAALLQTAAAREPAARDRVAGRELGDAPAQQPPSEEPPPGVYTAPPALHAFAWLPDGRRLVIAGDHELLLLGIPPRGEEAFAPPSERLPEGSPRIEELAVSPDGKLLLATGGAPTQWGEAQLWELDPPRLRSSLRVGKDSLFACAFTPDGRHCVVGGTDRKVHILEVGAWRELRAIGKHTDWILALTFSRDGALLASAGRDGALALHQTESGAYIDDANQPAEPILSLAARPDADLVVLGDEGGAVRSYRTVLRDFGDDVNRTRDVNRDREYGRLLGGVRALSFSAGGTLLAAGSLRGEVRVWESASGRGVAQLSTGAPVYRVAFRPGTEELAVGGQDGRLRLHDARTGQLLREMLPFPVDPSHEEEPPAPAERPRSP